MNFHEKFILALNAKKKIQLNYHDEATQGMLKRKCIPVDYCEYKKEGVNEEGFCFRLWDCDNGEMLSNSVKDEDIEDILILDEGYDNEEYKGSGFGDVKSIIALFVVFAIVALIIALIKFI